MDHGDTKGLTTSHIVDLGHKPVLTEAIELPLNPIQFQEVFARLAALVRHRPPLAAKDVPFKPVDPQIVYDTLRTVMPANFTDEHLWAISLCGSFTLNPDNTPRFVAVSETWQGSASESSS